MCEGAILGMAQEKWRLRENNRDIFSPGDEKNGLVPKGAHFCAYKDYIRAKT